MPRLDDTYKVESPSTPQCASFVVLCGWYKAKDAQLKRYSDVLRANGAVVLRTIMPPEDVYTLRESKRIENARALLAATREVRDARGYQELPLYLMFMSNGGCNFHAAMSSEKMLSDEGEFADLHHAIDVLGGGLIFDSCPCYLDTKIATKVFTMGMPSALARVASCAFRLSCALAAAANFVTRGYAPPLQYEPFWRKVRDAPPRRELYLFSEADDICVADKVDELVRERVRAGAAVKAKRWEKGRHVAHLYGENRKEYLALIEEFMRPSRMSCGLEFYLGEFSDVVFT
jgi:hypothetical protein